MGNSSNPHGKFALDKSVISPVGNLGSTNRALFILKMFILKTDEKSNLEDAGCLVLL